MSRYFAKAMQIMNSKGFYPETIEFDGRIHRFRANQSEPDKDCWYVAYERDSRVFLVFNDWSKPGPPYRFVIADDAEINETLKKQFEQELKLIAKREKAQRQILHETAALMAVKIWNESLISRNHPYLKRKKLGDSYGARINQQALIITAEDVDGKIWGLQRIFPNGSKRFLTNMKKKGCFFKIGTHKGSEPVAICEGFATAASFHEITGFRCYVAFDAGNLRSVAMSVRMLHPDSLIIFGADADDTGKEKALKAKASLGDSSQVVIPAFPKSSTGKDFNDLCAMLGLEKARDQILPAIESMIVRPRRAYYV